MGSYANGTVRKGSPSFSHPSLALFDFLLVLLAMPV